MAIVEEKNFLFLKKNIDKILKKDKINNQLDNVALFLN